MEIRPNLERKVDKLRELFVAFVKAQITASGFLLGALAVALIVANSTLADAYEQLRQLRIGIFFDFEL